VKKKGSVLFLPFLKRMPLIIGLLGVLSIVVIYVLSRKDDPSVGYFPEGIFEDFTAEWYSSTLQAMEEPSLFGASRSSKREAYRFLWLRSFHAPIAIRVERQGEHYSLWAKKLKMSYPKGEMPRPVGLTDRLEISLSKEQWSQFLSLLEESRFWKIPSQDDYSGFDGSNWILEGCSEGRYHVVDRWAPGDSHGPEFRKTCLFLIDLAGIFQDEEIY